MKTTYACTATRTLAVGTTLMLALVFAVSAQVASAQVLTRQLEVGMSGADVTALQTFLAKDPSLYPQGLVTGYFGFLTKAAVSNFQSRNGIAAVGRVGPQTLPVLNAQMATGATGGVTTAPIISSVSVNSTRNNATVNWATNEAARGVVYYSSSPLITYERENSVDVSGTSAQTDSAARSTQSVALAGLQPNTTYYYLIYTTDQDGNVSVTWPNSFRTNN